MYEKQHQGILQYWLWHTPDIMIKAGAMGTATDNLLLDIIQHVWKRKNTFLRVKFYYIQVEQVKDNDILG